MAVYISQHVRDAITSGKVNAVQCGMIADAINKFNSTLTTVDAEIVFINNSSYLNLNTAASGVDSRRCGFYSDGSPKIWIATSWKNGCNGSKGPRIFKGKKGKLTEWVSLRTYLR